MKKKKKEKSIDFGEWLYTLRKAKGYSEIDLMEIINDAHITEKNIKKWERDLEYPDLDMIYKLSEIYHIPAAEMLHIKEQTLKEGIEGVHKWIIRWISYLIGFSIYGTIWLCRILLTVSFILVWVWFYFKTLPVRV